MIGMNIKSATEACGGRLLGNGEINKELREIVIDSRIIQPGDLFAAYVGEKTDGHRFVSSAFDKGAACCLVSRPVEDENRPCILVEDVQKAVEDIARECRKRFSTPIIGVTGSVGKTTAKEMVYAVLSRKYSVHKTEMNFNNQIGVPMTLSGITPEHDLAVVEMGIQDFGDMALLADIARPDVGLFTTIGRAHLEFLHDLKGVLKAKTEMLDYMKPDAPIILNGDDEMLRSFSCSHPVLYYGFGENCDVRAENTASVSPLLTTCDICFNGKRLKVSIPAYGKHMVYAALEGVCAGILYGLSDEEIVNGIASYKVVGRRGEVTDNGFITVIDDCYNANPDSLSLGIESLSEFSSRKVCILADMLEQGENSAMFHCDCGRLAKNKGIDLVLACGEMCRYLCDGAGDIAHWYASPEEMKNALPGLLKQGDVILVKASHGMHLETISEFLKAYTG